MKVILYHSDGNLTKQLNKLTKALPSFYVVSSIMKSSTLEVILMLRKGS
jgi:hypothetical protein